MERLCLGPLSPLENAYSADFGTLNFRDCDIKNVTIKIHNTKVTKQAIQ